MPQPKLPPNGIVASGTVTALAQGTYDSQTKGFTYQQTDYLLTVQRQDNAPSCLEWTHATSQEAGKDNNPQVKMSSSTWNVVHNGSYDSQAGTYSYQQGTYEIRIEESGNDLYAVAVAL